MFIFLNLRFKRGFNQSILHRPYALLFVNNRNVKNVTEHCIGKYTFVRQSESREKGTTEELHPTSQPDIS